MADIMDITGGKTYYADSEYNATYTKDKAFDDNASSRWSSANSDFPHWIAVDLGKEKVVVRLVFTPYKGQVENFKLQGSNNSTNGSDGDWTDLLSSASTNSGTQRFTVSNTTGYRWYRLWITSKTGLDNKCASIYEIEIFDTAVLTPVMTANNAPSPYVVSLSTANYSNRLPYMAFDMAPDTAMLSASGNPTGIVTVDLGVDNAKVANIYVIYPYHVVSTEGRSPKTWTLEASNNNSDWTTLDTRTNITGWTAGTGKIFEMDNTTSYRYYRLNVTANGGDASYWGMTEFQLLQQILETVSTGIFFAVII